MSATAENLLEIVILGSCLRSTEWEFLAVGPSHLYFNLPRDSDDCFRCLSVKSSDLQKLRSLYALNYSSTFAVSGSTPGWDQVPLLFWDS